MPLVSSVIPNLVGGISQQPPALRLTTACENMVNTYPSIVSGLQKRPPTRHIANLGTALTSGVCGYLIERNESYRYLALLQNGDLKVLDLNTGTYQTVNFPNGKAYLSATSPVDSFRFVTFGDYTFIANRNVVVDSFSVTEPAISGETRLNPANMGTIYVTQAAYNTYYTVYVNGVLKASYLTPTGVSGSAACPDTSQIATSLASALNSAGYTTVQNGSTITISNLNSTDKLQTQGGTGDKSLRCFMRDIQSFSDLPPTCLEGRIVRVAGDPEKQGDDYYVVYKKGIWQETVDWDMGEELDEATMPHVLVRENDGTWTFKRHTWKGRYVGDDIANKTPSFVGKKINDVFVYTNRLGFLADENIILSEAANYENFYRTSTAQILDSDPIDLAVLHNNVDIVYHAVPYNRDLLLMSERNQFRFSYQNYLGPKNASIQFTTSYNVSRRVRPLNVGTSVYFVDDRSDYNYTKVYEFFPRDNSTQDDADEVSAPIPELIPNDILFTSSSNRAKMIAVASATDPTSLYMYKYFWAGERKVQNAWTKWTFSDCNKIYWAGFSGTYLYMVIERPYGVTLERMRLDEDVFDNDTNYEVMLDRRWAVTAGSMTYDAATDYTFITLPYSTSVTPEVVSADAVNQVYGFRNEVTKLNASEIKVKGDIRTYTVVTGIPYTKFFEFSTFFAKQQKGQGEVIMQDGRLQIRYLSLEYHNTAFFYAKVLTPGRSEALSTFVGSIIGGEDAELGLQPFASGKYRLPIMAENLKVRIQLYNDSPFPSAFGSAEWQGIVSPKSVSRI